MNKTTGIILWLLLFAGPGIHLRAQDYNPLPVAMPSLQIAPDARGGGMGDMGASTMPDVYSQHWNAAKYPFITSQAGFAFSYTPWLSKLTNGINLLYASGYRKFGENGLNVVSASLRYFTFGDIDVPDMSGEFWRSVAPHELALDVAYSRKLSETFSGAVALRYLRADYSTGEDEGAPGNAFAVDIAGYNEVYLLMGRSEALLGVGFNLSNIGTKKSYDAGATTMFLPANMRLGASLGYPLDAKNTISLSVDLNKLLVPTPQLPKEGETADETEQRVNDYNNISSIGGIFQSFADATGGFKEEMQEIIWSFGAEYTYDNQFSLRTGYHHENEYKGNRRYMAFGAGFRSSGFQVDAAYLVSVSPSNPMDQTLRLSLGFDLDGLRALFF